MTGREKVLVKITSHGVLTCFGYSGLRTPATVELYEHQLAVLQQQGVQFELIKEKTAPISRKKKES
jgi:hypothetical protein